MAEPQPARADAGRGERPRLMIGAMSGTSADGVDIALVRVRGRGTDMSAELVAHHARPYDPHLRRLIFSLRQGGPVALGDVALATRQISLTYAAAVNEALLAAGLGAADVEAVAAHGQTLYHAPPDTVQVFDPSLVAGETGCRVVSDFRRADCAAGGQGAPLVPFADYVLFRHPEKNRVLLNIGGIANLTFLPAGASADRVMAFDTGPGNCISDFVMRQREPAGPGFDTDGRLALMGTPFRPLVDDVFREEEYFRLRPPKSTDVPAMSAAYARARERVVRRHGPLSLEDELATAVAITTTAIHRAVDDAEGMLRVPCRWDVIDELIVSGGGTHNRAIMQSLRPFPRGGQGPVLTADRFGIPSEAKEAVAFALLGAATLDGVPSNVPSATGAGRPVVLGSITPKP